MPACLNPKNTDRCLRRSPPLPLRIVSLQRRSNTLNDALIFYLPYFFLSLTHAIRLVTRFLSRSSAYWSAPRVVLSSYHCPSCYARHPYGTANLVHFAFSPSLGLPVHSSPPVTSSTSPCSRSTGFYSHCGPPPSDSKGATPLQATHYMLALFARNFPLRVLWTFLHRREGRLPLELIPRSFQPSQCFCTLRWFAHKSGKRVAGV